VILAATAVVAMFELDKARELPFRDYVYSQVRRVDDRVLPPPPDIAVYFGSHKEAFAEMRRRPEGADEFSDRFAEGSATPMPLDRWWPLPADRRRATTGNMSI